MNFLIDENLSPTLCTYLTTTVDAATHVRDVTGTGAKCPCLREFGLEHRWVSSDGRHREDRGILSLAGSRQVFGCYRRSGHGLPPFGALARRSRTVHLPA